jgi:transposase
MVLLEIDAHKRTHTVVAVDEHGRKLGECTVGTTTVGTTTDEHVRLLVWADRFGTPWRWAVEDCRHLSGHNVDRDGYYMTGGKW